MEDGIPKQLHYCYEGVASKIATMKDGLYLD